MQARGAIGAEGAAGMSRDIRRMLVILKERLDMRVYECRTKEGENAEIVMKGLKSVFKES